MPLNHLPKTRIALAAAALAAGAGLSPAVLAKPPAGAEFRVNTTTTGQQGSPIIGMDADGDFVVAWAGADSGGLVEVFLQRYSAAGQALGSEFLAHPATPASAEVPIALGMQANGDFVVFWDDGLNNFAQRFHANGTPLNAQIALGSSGDLADAALQANGDFVTVSNVQEGGRRNPTAGNAVFAQRRQTDGTALGDAFRVNNFNTANQQNPAIAMDADGDFVIAWESDGQDGSGYGIYAQRYNSSGVAQGGEFQVNTFTTSDQSAPAIAMDADGDFVVSWRSIGQDGNSFGIYAQRYNSSGVAQGGEFRVNTFTTSDQLAPAIAMDVDGDFVVSWQSFGQDGDLPGIYAQRYNSNGLAQGGEFRVNTFTTNRQNAPSIALDADGDFVIAWESFGQDDPAAPNVPGVYAQRYQAVTLTPSLTVTTSGATTNTTPVAGGPGGTYSFNAQFCNNTAQTMTGLSSKTLTLTNSNNLLNRTRDAFAAPGAAAIPPGGPGTEKDVTAANGYADLALASSECVTVPYQIGLANRNKFNFTVRIRGDNGL